LKLQVGETHLFLKWPHSVTPRDPTVDTAMMSSCLTAYHPD
jgi:hypothetical protein